MKKYIHTLAILLATTLIISCESDPIFEDFETADFETIEKLDFTDVDEDIPNPDGRKSDDDDEPNPDGKRSDDDDEPNPDGIKSDDDDEPSPDGIITDGD